MASKKTKVNFSSLKKIPIDARTTAARELKTEVLNAIKDQVEKGISPVKGFNRYKDYAESTAKKKGRKRPVTLKETGKMMDSLTAQQSKKGVKLFFKGARNSKIANYHHTGTDKMDARPVLPFFKGQQFKRLIQDKINNAYKKAVAKAIKKNK